MKYEIPREIFKQRLVDKLNFAIIDVQASATNVFEGTTQLAFDDSFTQNFVAKYPAKTQNTLLFSLKPNDHTPALAADQLSQLGYQFVYYYSGDQGDIVLDKGLN